MCCCFKRCKILCPSHYIQQTLVFVGIALNSFSDGFIFGQMSGMLEALRVDNTTISLNDNDLSWLASSINITCSCGFAMIAIVAEAIGRKKAVIVATIPAILSWIMTYFAMDKTTLHLSKLLSGMSYGCTLFLNFVNIGEYISPSIRFMSFNMLVSIGSIAGTMAGHVLSVLMEWRNVALLGIILSIMSIILPCFWVESPMWLASRGRFQECDTAFRSLRAPSESAEDELNLLFALETDKQKRVYTKKTPGYKNIIGIVKQKYFWKVNVLLHTINIYRVAAGRVLFNTLAITMLQDITGTSDILLFTLVLNGFAIFGAGLSCVLMKKLKLRNLLFPTLFIANFLLIGLGTIFYFKPNRNAFWNWTKILVYALYLLAINIGPYPILEAMIAEICPLEIKAFSYFIQSVVTGMIQFLAIKFAPNLFLSIGYHGVFFLNATIVFICFFYFLLFLPETKGRSLQEIELYFKTNSFQSRLQSEEGNELLDMTKNKMLKQNKHSLI